MATKSEASLDLDPLHRLKSTEPPVWLAPRADLSETARTASKNLFSYLRTYAPKSPLDQLLIQGFDAEQIWQQIDLQLQPLLSSLKREVKKFEKRPEEIWKIREVIEGGEKKVVESEGKILEGERKVLEEESDGFDEELDDGLDDDDEEEEDKVEGSESEEEENGEEDKGKRGGGGGIEDEFLKINELQEYLEEDEAREYGLKKGSSDTKKKGGRRVLGEEDEEEEEEDDEDDDVEDDEEVKIFISFSPPN